MKNGAHTVGKDKDPGIRVVEENKKKYTDRDVKRADRARRFQELPSVIVLLSEVIATMNRG